MTSASGGEAFADRPLGEWLEEWSRVAPREHARRAARAIYAGDARPWELNGIARALRRALEELRPRVPLPQVLRAAEAADGTEKLLLDVRLGAGPGAAVETVLIPDARAPRSRAHMQTLLAPAARRDLGRRPPRASGCVSSQVGCGVGCTFCASGLEGLTRNLRARDMVAQALHLRARAQARGYHLGALVFMGMGEPFHNLRALRAALENLTSPDGAGFGVNHVTVSTVGVPAGIEALAERGPAVNLALSLHAPDDETRARIVPLAAKLPPARELLALCREYQARTRRQVTLSYVLLEGVNDAPAQARDLAALLRPFPELAHVNLIPFNAAEGLPHRRPSPARVSAFHEALRAAGLRSHVRRTRGAEADAACGQLRERASRAPARARSSREPDPG